MGEVKSKPNPKQVFDACVGGILEGLTQKQIIKTLDISKDTLKKKLSKKNTSWKELTGQKKVDIEVSGKGKVDQKIKSKSAAQTPPSLNSAKQQPGESPGTSSLDPIEQAKLTMINFAQSDPRVAMDILKNQHLFQHTETISHYTRPVQPLDIDGNEQIYLNERQQEIIDCMLDNKTRILLVEGDRRTGKTTAWYYGMLESMLEGTRKKWGMWAATEQTCMKLHRDAVNDPKFFKYHGHLVKRFTAKHTDFIMEGCLLETHATKMSDASGLQYQGIIIDEFQQVIKDNAEAFATISGISRSEPDIKILLVCNQGGSVYRFFKKKMDKLIAKGLCKYFTLEEKDTVHITEEANEICETLMEASMGSAFAKAQLKNIYNATGDTFNADSIEWAYTNYKMMKELETPVPVKKIMGVDPSGAGHPFGWCIMATNSGGRFFWEIDSGEMELASELWEVENGEKWTQERINAYLVSKAKENHVDMIVIESNMSGPAMRLKFLQNQLPCMIQNFGNPKTEMSRDNMIGITRTIMDSERMILRGEDLQNSLLKYDPDKETKAKRKGDSADAMIHAIYKLCELTVSFFMYGSNEVMVR